MKFNWQPGRQQEGYYTLKLFSFWRIDAYIIKCCHNVAIKEHFDKVPSKRHIRVNFTFKGKDNFYIVPPHKAIFSLMKRFTIFRPDICLHGTGIGNAWKMVSVGFILDDKKNEKAV